MFQSEQKLWSYESSFPMTSVIPERCLLLDGRSRWGRCRWKSSAAWKQLRLLPAEVQSQPASFSELPRKTLISICRQQSPNLWSRNVLRLTLVSLGRLADVDGQLTAERVDAHHPGVSGGSGERRQLVVAAGDTVERLGEVSGSL
ncbi:hypothetical protein GOODEAATRI_006911 [Goodea atripinnis]|uniref:Uncharacterized protein n=1 Tax=Goodea atripinnis TaxID=208336 RepID=A0ABV0PC20_9TELE